jgi:hypothetical protein
LISVVRRPFKTNGEFYAAGTVITDPAAIRLYKTKVAEGKIVEVDEHNIDRVSEYLLHKQGEEAKALFDKGFLIVTAEELAYIEDIERTAQKEAEAAKEAEAKKAEEAKKAAEVKKPTTAPKTT